MSSLERVHKAQQELAEALGELKFTVRKEPTPTIVEVSPESWVVTAGSGGCRINGVPVATFLQEGDVYALHHNENENLAALRTSLSECIAERDAARRDNDALNAALIESNTQRGNLQEFNDKQRQQLESLQKEMAAIHLCVTAASRTKLEDAMHRNVERGMEAPFLLKAAYEAMDRYFDTKAAAERRISKINAARKELES